MDKYQKIDSVWRRNADLHHTIRPGEYSTGVLEMLSGISWVWQEKVHGRNHRVIYRGESTDGPTVEHRGKSDAAHMPDHLMDDVTPLLTEERLHGVFGETDVCLYAEAFGPRINGGDGYGDTHRLCLFDVRIGDWWLEMDDVSEIADDLGLPYAPVIGSGTLPEACESIRDTVDSRITSRVADGAAPVEGFVLRPMRQLFDRRGARVITKIKYRDYEKRRSILENLNTDTN